MYNGIGLQTSKGSGTNGYVQTNKGFVRKHKDHIDYKTEEEMKLNIQRIKQPNKEILDHERKRKVELKCMEMEELMKEQGYSTDDIEQKVSVFRKMLVDKEAVEDSSTVEKNKYGRPVPKGTHQIAEATAEKNARLKEAFGISEYYVDGSSFDPNRKAKEEDAEAQAVAKRKYRPKETHQIAEATAEKNARLKEAFGISEHYVDGSSFHPNRKAKEEDAKSQAKRKYRIGKDSDNEPHPPKKKSWDKSSSPEKSRRKKRRKRHKHDR